MLLDTSSTTNIRIKNKVLDLINTYIEKYNNNKVLSEKLELLKKSIIGQFLEKYYISKYSS